MRRKRLPIRRWIGAFLLIICLSSTAVALGENSFPLIGDWAFSHAPETSVLLVRKDGTAVYDGRSWAWSWDKSVPLLILQSSDKEIIRIRYFFGEDGILIYLPAAYTRKDKLVDEEIWGAWINDRSEMSSFIFEKDGRFMEDNTFVGRYSVDKEAGSILLQYQPTGYFNDTLCYFDRDGDHMMVYYPWPITATQAVH